MQHYDKHNVIKIFQIALILVSYVNGSQRKKYIYIGIGKLPDRGMDKLNQG